MNTQEDVETTTLEQLIQGTNSGSFDLGVWSGLRQATQFIRELAGQKFSEEKDKEARMYRELAKMLEVEAETAWKNYESGGQILRNVCWKKLDVYIEKLEEKTKVGELKLADFSGEIVETNTPEIREKPAVRKGRKGHPNWVGGPHWTKTEDEILMDAVLEAMASGEFKHGNKNNFFKTLTDHLIDRTWSGIASRWLILAKSDQFLKKVAEQRAADRKLHNTNGGLA